MQGNAKSVYDIVFRDPYEESRDDGDNGHCFEVACYAHLRRKFWEAGRLALDNNRSERALRGTIATGRKAWLFVGSDDHGQSAAHLFSLVASCRMHSLDPESYFHDLFHVLAHWPKDRYLELAHKYWATARARLDPRELGVEIGSLTTLRRSARRPKCSPR